MTKMEFLEFTIGWSGAKQTLPSTMKSYEYVPNPLEYHNRRGAKPIQTQEKATKGQR